MANLPLDLIAVYVSFVIWLVLLVRDYKQQRFTATIVFGIALLLYLNLRYLLHGAAEGIAFFVALYDVFDNLGLAAGETARALATCPGNECSVWGDRYLNHQSWGVAFYERFANGPELRSNLLYAHLLFNSIVFVLMHVQIAKPAGPNNKSMHRILGRISFVLLTLGTISACWLASELDPVSAYGGALSKWGFWFMSSCVYFCAVMGVVKIRHGEAAAHRVWMIRFAGSMWGAFWLFRIMLIVTGPLLRNYETVSILISIWFSAPLGILLAELMRKKLEKRSSSAQGVGPSVAVSA